MHFFRSKADSDGAKRLENDRAAALRVTAGALLEHPGDRADDELLVAVDDEAEANPFLKGVKMGDVRRSLRSVPERGARFEGDSSAIAFFIQRSKNANTVVYEVRPTAARPAGSAGSEAGTEAVSESSDAVDAYWLELEPSYRAKLRAQGQQDDRKELNFVERKMAYGITVAPSSDEADGPKVPQLAGNVLRCRFVALPSHPMLLLASRLGPSLDQEALPLPVMLTIISGELAIAERAFVKAHEPKHFWELPTVEYVDLHGTALRSAAPVSERIVP